MTDNEFMREAQAAVERMREMNARSKTNNNPHKMPPSPSFVRVNNINTQQKHTPPPRREEKDKPPPSTPPKLTQNNSFGIPILDNLLTDGDSALIIGLLLILMSENTDKMLLFALIYILI